MKKTTFKVVCVFSFNTESNWGGEQPLSHDKFHLVSVWDAQNIHIKSRIIKRSSVSFSGAICTTIQVKQWHARDRNT